MMINDKISIIMPVYNSEKYLEQAINSVINQTYKNIELILIDDGSTDNSLHICNLYSKKDNRIKTLTQKNAGQACARNVGVKYSKGEWLCFIDSDDLINDRMLEMMINAVYLTDSNMCMCKLIKGKDIPTNFYDCVESNYCSYEITEEKLIDLYYYGEYKYWTVGGKFIRKSIFYKNPFISGRVYEDNAVVYKWICDSKKIVDFENYLYFYRINNNSTTNKQFSLKTLDYLLA